MQVSGQSLFELAKNIDAAAIAAHVSDGLDQAQSCYQVCVDQVVEQLFDEYHLELSVNTQLQSVKNKESMQLALLKLLPLAARQRQTGKHEGLDAFKTGYKLLLARGLQDGLDIMTAQDLWRFDIQRNVQQVQKRVFSAVDHFSC